MTYADIKRKLADQKTPRPRANLNCWCGRIGSVNKGDGWKCSLHAFETKPKEKQ